jgi:hypothetical protein
VHRSLAFESHCLSSSSSFIQSDLLNSFGTGSMQRRVAVELQLVATSSSASLVAAAHLAALSRSPHLTQTTQTFASPTSSTFWLVTTVLIPVDSFAAAFCALHFEDACLPQCIPQAPVKSSRHRPHACGMSFRFFLIRMNHAEVTPFNAILATKKSLKLSWLIRTLP